MALCREYFKLTSKYINEYGERTLLLYQVGAFFECYGYHDSSTETVYGSQITEFCRICDLNIANKNMEIEGIPVFMAGFSHYMLDKYLKRLNEEGYTSVVYKQEEHNKTSRTLYGIFSPGTYFSEESQQITNNTACVWVTTLNSYLLKKKVYQIGMSNINIYNGECIIFEYQTEYIKSPTSYDELERFISIYNPNEIIIISDEENIDDIISFANIQTKSIHRISLCESNKKRENIENINRAKNCERQTYQSSILQKFYNIDNVEQQHEYYTYTIALQSLCYLLDFIYIHNPNLVKKIKQPKFENCSQRLILANHSLKQLNIIHDNLNGGKYSCVEKLLNICITPMGRRRFSNQLLNPTTNVEYLQEEYDNTEHILKHFSSYDFLKSKLSLIKDISKLQRQSIIKKITPKSLYYIYKNLFIVKELFQLLQTDKDKLLEKYLKNKVSKYSNLIENCNNLIHFLEFNFNLSLCETIDTFSQFEINFIKKDVDPFLDKKTLVYETSYTKLETFRNDFNKIISKYEKEKKKRNTSSQSQSQTQLEDNVTTTVTTDYVKLHETEKNNISLVSTKRRCEILKKAVDPSLNLVFHNQSASNETISNIEITQLCSNISSIKVELKDIITQVYFDLLEKLQDYQEQLDNVIEFITILDLMYAKATLANNYNYCKPSIVLLNKNIESSYVDAKKIRHPLIEHIQNDELYIANDISLGLPDQKGVLLFGVNMVGKTSLIKSIGISIIMAQAGLYVPASNFVYYPYKYLFTRILNNDNLFKGLSTFAVEMSELRTILKIADNKSLILGDEIASGSESSSAISIFLAALRSLYGKQSSFIFATHMHEVVGLEEIAIMKNVKMKHLEVEYNREKDMLIYNRVLQDGSGSSNYGLEVAKYLKLPDDFLEDANNLRLKYFLQKNDEGSVLSLKTSHYNSKKLVGLCEICKKEKGTEVHHLIHQQESNEKGVITTDDGAVLFHKNHIANLISICEKCHLQMHSSQLKIVKNTKETTDEAVSEITVEGTVERTVEGVTTVEGISESILKEEVKKVSKKKKTTKGIILTES